MEEDDRTFIPRVLQVEIKVWQIAWQTERLVDQGPGGAGDDEETVPVRVSGVTICRLASQKKLSLEPLFVHPVGPPDKKLFDTRHGADRLFAESSRIDGDRSPDNGREVATANRLLKR